MFNHKPKTMKKLLFLFLFVSLLSGCSKPGNLELTISYFYNNFQGYRPDVGAKAMLFKSSVSQRLCMDSITLPYAETGIFYDNNGKYIKDEDILKAEADVSGKINFKDLSNGKYLLIVSSKGRHIFSKKEIEIESGKTLSVVKNFEVDHDMDYKGESWN